MLTEFTNASPSLNVLKVCSAEQCYRSEIGVYIRHVDTMEAILYIQKSIFISCFYRGSDSVLSPDHQHTVDFVMENINAIFFNWSCISRFQFPEAWSSLRIKARCMPHYDDVIMGVMASQITSLTIVYSTVYSGADQSTHQSSASLAFVWGIHRGPVNSPHKWPATRIMFPFDDVIMLLLKSDSGWSTNPAKTG